MKTQLPLSRSRAALTAALVLTSSSLPAAVISWGGANATTPIGTGFDSSGIWLNFFTGSVTQLNSGDPYPPFALGQFQINHNGVNGYVNLVNQTPFFGAAQWVTIGNGPARLAAGDSIDGFSSFTDQFTIFASTGDDFFNSFDALASGYLGVSFTDAAVNTYYGYIEVDMGLDFSVTLIRFAYESVPGTPILAGATVIPEPASASALVGAIFLGGALLRRRSLRTHA